MDAEKDRLGDKLRDLERAREDKFFADRDRELLEKLRRDPGAAGLLTCPTCSARLALREQPPLRVYACPTGHGCWLSADDLAALDHPGAPAALARLASLLSEG